MRTSFAPWWLVGWLVGVVACGSGGSSGGAGLPDAGSPGPLADAKTGDVADVGAADTSGAADVSSTADAGKSDGAPLSDAAAGDASKDAGPALDAGPASDAGSGADAGPATGYGGAPIPLDAFAATLAVLLMASVVAFPLIGGAVLLAAAAYSACSL